MILKGLKVFTGLETEPRSYDKFNPRTKVRFWTTSCNSCYKKIQWSKPTWEPACTCPYTHKDTLTSRN